MKVAGIFFIRRSETCSDIKVLSGHTTNDTPLRSKAGS